MPLRCRLPIFFGVLCLLYAMTLPRAQADHYAPLRVDAYASVVTDEQRAELILPALSKVQSLQVSKWGGAQVLVETIPAGRTQLILPKLDAGYYTITFGEHQCPLAVIAGASSRLGPSSVVALDSNITWQVVPEEMDDVAALIKACGMQWVRERVHWGWIEEKRDQYNWKSPDRAVGALHRAGLKVMQAYHNVPRWSRADGSGKAPSDNLLEAYEFARDFADRFKGKVYAFEGWNEPNLHFFHGLPDKLASVQKVWYMGMKDGNKDIRVLAPAFTRMHPTYTWDQDYLRLYLANHAGRFFDVMNIHHYGAVKNYKLLYETVRQQLDDVGLTDIPCWSSESGTMAFDVDEKSYINQTMQRQQATFLSQMYPSGLAAGEERMFWYVATTWITPSGKWHSLLSYLPDAKNVRKPNKQGLALPALCALSNTAHMLADGRYLGQIQGLHSDVRAELFDRGNQTVCLAIWNQSETASPVEVTLPVAGSAVKDWRDYLGSPVTVPAKSSLVFPVAEQTQYIVLPRQLALDALALTPAKPTTKPSQATHAQSRQVARLVFPAKLIDEKALAYRMDPSQANVAALEVYNLDDTPFTGKIQFQSNSNWLIEPHQADVQIPAMSRASIDVTIQAKNTTNRLSNPVVFDLLDTHGQVADHVVLNLCIDMSKKEAEQTQTIPIDDLSRWQPNTASIGQTQIKRTEAGTIGFEIKANANSVKHVWAFPTISFDRPMDMSAFNAIQFEMKSDTPNIGPIRVHLVEEDQTIYSNTKGTLAQTDWQKVTVFFDKMVVVERKTDMDNGFMDVDKIVAIRFGSRFKHKQVQLQIRNVQLVNLPE